MRSKLGRLMQVTSAAVVLVAATSVGGPAHAAALDREHCWSELDTDRSLCAETEEQLALDMYERYGVTIEARPLEVLPESVTAPGSRAKRIVESARAETGAADAPTPRASYILVKGYSGKSYSGYSRTWTAQLSATPCVLQQSYAYGQYEYLHNFNFNDQMRSYHVASGCRLRVYADTKFRGTMRGPYGDSKTLGILDLEVSSMRIVK